MIIDLNKVEHDPFKNKTFDFCICGAGVAGITLAIKLSKKFNVVLLEGGGLELSAESQDLYRGKIIGLAYYPPSVTRLRYFGGTSNHWAGWCFPMRSHDFKSKPYVEYSGWPIERADLEPFLNEAETMLDIPQVNSDLYDSYKWDAEKVITSSNDLKTIEYKWSAPTRFGEKFGSTIRHSENVACYLNANIVDLRLHDNLSRLDAVEIHNFSGITFKLHSKTFVLATGGIENPRILLNSNKQLQEGLGNKNGLVGRFFTDHNNKLVGEFILEDSARASLLKSSAPNWRQNNSYFSPTVQFMERDKILNFGIFVQPNGNLLKKRNFKDRLKNMLCEMGLSENTVERISGEPCANDGTIRVVSEQALNPSSRVILGSEVDRYGLKRISLDWKQSEIDKRTIQLAVITLAKIFAAKHLGRIRIEDWVLTDSLVYPTDDEVAGHHHMCTTRMSDSPQHGVVDSNQKVFDIDNLYIGGSSVFSTAGHDCPTITIVQMTLRLAKHLEYIHKTEIV